MKKNEVTDSLTISAFTLRRISIINKTKSKMKKTLFSIAFACVAMGGYAQSKSHKVKVVIPEVMDLQMEETDMTFSYGQDNIRDNENPDAQEREVRVRSNVAWNVSVYAESDFKASDTENSDITIEVLTLSVPDGEGGSSSITPDKQTPVMTDELDIAGNLIPLLVDGNPVFDTNAKVLAQGSKGGYGVNTNNVSYSVDLSKQNEDYFTVDPDTYTTTLVYTVSAQ